MAELVLTCALTEIMEPATSEPKSRADGRVANQLRPLAAEPGALDKADGSARFGHDRTRVLVAVHGPLEAKRSQLQPERAVVLVKVRPRSGIPGPVEREMETLLSQTLQQLVLASQFPRTSITLAVQKLGEDGSMLATALHGCCVALMHAGVPLRGMVAGCAIAFLPDGTALLDPDLEEERAAAAVVTLGYTLRTALDGSPERRLCLSHVRGAVSEAQYSAATEAAQQAAGAVGAFCRQALQRSQGDAPPA